MRDAAAIRRALWAALEVGQPKTLDDLEVITGVGADWSVPYLDQLLRHGYVALCGHRQAASGEYVCMFRLVHRPGPEPPVFDRDAAPAVTRPVQRPVAQPIGNQASPRARILVAAERFGRPFEIDELVAVVGGEEPWRLRDRVIRLTRQGRLRRLPTGLIEYVPQPDSLEERMCAFARTRLRQPITQD